MIYERDPPACFPPKVHEAFPPVVGAAPPLQQEAIDPLSTHEYLARLGVERNVLRETVEALRQAR
jgi:hypothetical protein